MIKLFHFSLFLPAIYRKCFFGHRITWLICLCGNLLFPLISGIRTSDQKHILSPRIQVHCGCWEMSTIRISSLAEWLLVHHTGHVSLCGERHCPLACIRAITLHLVSLKIFTLYNGSKENRTPLMSNCN